MISGILGMWDGLKNKSKYFGGKTYFFHPNQLHDKIKNYMVVSSLYWLSVQSSCAFYYLQLNINFSKLKKTIGIEKS